VTREPDAFSLLFPNVTQPTGPSEPQEQDAALTARLEMSEEAKRLLGNPALGEVFRGLWNRWAGAMLLARGPEVPASLITDMRVRLDVLQDIYDELGSIADEQPGLVAEIQQPRRR